MLRSICLLVLLAAPAVAAKPEIRVVDDQGQPVDSFEIMWHTPERGCGLWENRERGTAELPWLRAAVDGGALDIIIRADGYATTVKRYQGPFELVKGDMISVPRGRDIRVRFNLPEGLSLPDDFEVQSYFPEFQWRVHVMWQPANIRDRKPDWNMLNVKRSDETEFTLRLPQEAREFYLAIQHPGWLQFCELGPFSESDIVENTLLVDMPSPAAIEVEFAAKDHSGQGLPFDEVACTIYWAPDESNRVYQVTNSGTRIERDRPFTLSDLGPGKYWAHVTTIPRDGVENISGTEINPGRFFERKAVTLGSGDHQKIDISWAPFDADAHRGDAHARIAIRNPDGSAPSERSATVSWYDGHYGSHVVHQEQIPDDGIIELRNVSAKRRRSAAPFGPYSISVNNERLGFFTLDPIAEVQEFQFTITPGVGDVAPDVSFVDVATQQVSKLSDHHGKVRLLEFWSIGCGPCQPAMRKLNRLVERKSAEWQDQVTIVSLSTDHDPDSVRRHAESRGWTAMPHYIGTREDGAYFSEAQTAFVILGVPEGILIDQSGTIVWRGHPSAFDEGKISQLLPTADASSSQ